MEVEHFSHPDHPLILINEVIEYIGEHVICSGCEETISGPCYSCNSCFFFLHKKCAELLREIKQHLHPQHPLILLAKPPYDYVRCACDLCHKICKSFVYHCSLCHFDLDINCALPPCLLEADGHRHQFRRLLNSIPLKSMSFTCNACGTDGDGNELPSMCTACQLVVHKKCVSLRQTIKIRQHPHYLTQTYFPPEDESGKPYCGVCQIQFKPGNGGYQCKDCKFFAHINCALEFDNSESIATYNNNESIHSSKPTALGIKHFSHHHSLILIDEFKDNMKYCAGCMLPISNPSYGCTQCNFSLHKACSELPKSLQLDGDLLTLFSRADTVNGIFSCFICDQYCHGFVYISDFSPFMMYDIRCGVKASSGTITHEGHKHKLFLYKPDGFRHCNACSGVENWYLFRCAICDFNLDFRCATLPREARHEYDEHPLFLTYIDPNDYQFVCIICEKERDPKFWFYRCEECDFDAHPECVLGKHPYIKLGGRYKYDIHHHPLGLIEKTEDDHPVCHNCGESFGFLALECTDSECNFIIHTERQCTNP